MSQHNPSSSGSFATLVTGAVIGAAGLAFWLLNEADRRRRLGQQRSILYAPRMQDGSEVLNTHLKGHSGNQQLEERVERLNAEIARVRSQLEQLGSED